MINYKKNHIFIVHIYNNLCIFLANAKYRIISYIVNLFVRLNLI